jgi:hypothetical protein
VPPNVRRLLPMFIIVAAVLFILPALTRKHSSGPSSATKATTTFAAMTSVEKSEQQYLTAHARYTSHVADLLTLAPALAGDLSTVAIQLDVSSDGQTFLAHVSSDVLGLVRARGKTASVANTCTILKSGKGVSCPAKS